MIFILPSSRMANDDPIIRSYPPSPGNISTKVASQMACSNEWDPRENRGEKVGGEKTIYGNSRDIFFFSPFSAPEERHHRRLQPHPRQHLLLRLAGGLAGDPRAEGEASANRGSTQTEQTGMDILFVFKHFLDTIPEIFRTRRSASRASAAPSSTGEPGGSTDSSRFPEPSVSYSLFLKGM